MKIRALVLAAGFGSRLAPLTSSLPKPLIPVLGRSILHRNLRSLAAFGCEQAAVNLHHLGDQIPDQIGASVDGMPIHYSAEESILGTLGGLLNLWDQFRDCDHVLIVNGDSLCDWPWRSLLTKHLRSGAGCSLLVHQTLDPTAYGGGVGLDRQGRVTRLRGLPEESLVAAFRVFLGVQILSRRMFGRIEHLVSNQPAPSDLVADLYLPLLFEGEPPNTVATRRRWHDLGTPRRYLTAARSAVPGWRKSRSWISPTATVDPAATVNGSVFESGASAAANARITDSLIMPRAMIGAECHLSDSIVASDVVLPAATQVHGQMVTKPTQAYRLRTDDSQLGELVFSPLS